LHLSDLHELKKQQTPQAGPNVTTFGAGRELGLDKYGVPAKLKRMVNGSYSGLIVG
jgi:hypothetical protein